MEELGRGAFGVVYRCIDHKDGSMVAVKVIRNRRRFTRQAEVERLVLLELGSVVVAVGAAGATQAAAKELCFVGLQQRQQEQEQKRLVTFVVDKKSDGGSDGCEVAGGGGGDGGIVAGGGGGDGGIAAGGDSGCGVSTIGKNPNSKSVSFAGATEGIAGSDERERRRQREIDSDTAVRKLLPQRIALAGSFGLGGYRSTPSSRVAHLTDVEEEEDLNGVVEERERQRRCAAAHCVTMLHAFLFRSHCCFVFPLHGLNLYEHLKVSDENFWKR